jgi:hypothetical protein
LVNAEPVPIPKALATAALQADTDEWQIIKLLAGAGVGIFVTLTIMFVFRDDFFSRRPLLRSDGEHQSRNAVQAVGEVHASVPAKIPSRVIPLRQSQLRSSLLRSKGMT